MNIPSEYTWAQPKLNRLLFFLMLWIGLFHTPLSFAKTYTQVLGKSNTAQSFTSNPQHWSCSQIIALLKERAEAIQYHSQVNSIALRHFGERVEFFEGGEGLVTIHYSPAFGFKAVKSLAFDTLEFRPDILEIEANLIRSINAEKKPGEVLPFLDPVSHKIDGIPFLIMRAVEHNLKEKLSEIAEGPIEEIPHVMDQLLLGLEKIHEKGLVVKDIKPKNILIEKDSAGRWRVYLIDLSMADDPHINSAKSEGSVAGSTSHMPESQILSDRYRAEHDLFALRKTLQEMILGTEISIISDDTQLKVEPTILSGQLYYKLVSPEGTHSLPRLKPSAYSLIPEEKKFLWAVSQFPAQSTTEMSALIALAKKYQNPSLGNFSDRFERFLVEYSQGFLGPLAKKDPLAAGEIIFTNTDLASRFETLPFEGGTLTNTYSPVKLRLLTQMASEYSDPSYPENLLRYIPSHQNIGAPNQHILWEPFFHSLLRAGLPIPVNVRNKYISTLSGNTDAIDSVRRIFLTPEQIDHHEASTLTDE